MRIVSWNCNGAFRQKFVLADKLDADILVIQECENPAHYAGSEYAAWSGAAFCWTGESRHKGLGIFVRKSWLQPVLRAAAPSVRHFLPVCFGEFTVCGVWAHKDLLGSRHYIGQVWQLLQTEPQWMKDGSAILIGDFNSNAIWDKPRCDWSHSRVVRALQSLGYRSALHEIKGWQHGLEREPTFFMRRQAAKPYHIDYGFIGPAWNVASARIHSDTTWLQHSDHLPLDLVLSENPLFRQTRLL